MTKFLTAGDVLKYLLNKNSMSEVSLGQEIGIPRATINRITSGRTSDPRASTLNAIAAYFNITTEQLLGLKPILLEKEQKVDEGIRSIPILEWEEAKNWVKAIETTDQNKKLNWLSDNMEESEANFALIYKGESMWPQFQENALLIISTTREVKNNDFVIAYIKNRNETIFRKLVMENKYRILKPNNLIFPSIELEPEDRIIGTVIQSRNNF